MRRWWPIAFVGLTAAAFLFRSSKSFVERRIPSGRARVVPSAESETHATPDGPTSPTARPRIKKTLVRPCHAGCEPPQESLVSRSFRWLLQAQNEDGSWGNGLAYLDGHPVDEVAMTSLALLTFLGAGYTPTSKEVKGEIRIGDAVRKGVRWLMARQAEDGSFATTGDTTLALSMGALALNETYGLTGSPVFVESAQGATDALVSSQVPDGSWGDAYRGGWAAMALASARISGLSLEEDVRERLRLHARTQLEKGPNLPAMVEGVFFGRENPPELFDATLAAVLASPARADRPEATYWYWAALALFQVDGPKGERWKAWSGSLREALLRVVGTDGRWEGVSPNDSLLKTSLATLSSELYYRYANVLGERTQ